LARINSSLYISSNLFVFQRFNGPIALWIEQGVC
jgi:hypothetical protein